MKVLHIFRGFEDYMIELLNIQSEDMQVYVAIPQSSQWIKPLLDKRIIITDLEPKSVKSLSNIHYLFRLLSYIFTLKPDVIHIQAGVIWECAIFLACKYRFRVFTTIHDVTCHPSENKSRQMQKWIDYSIRKSDGLICHTDESKDLIQKVHKINSAYKIPHPIIKQYHPNGTSKSERKIIFFGTLDKWKGLEILEESLEQLKEANIKVEIRGNSRFKEYYTSLFEKHKNVHLDIKRQSKEEIEYLFSSGSVLVLPYIEASQSGVIHIAMHFEIPVIASRVGGLKELIEQHHLAIGFEPEDSIDLANKIKYFFESQDVSDQIQKNQQVYKEGVASPRNILELYKKAYSIKNN